METEKTMLIYFVLFHSSFNAVSLFLTDFSQIWISFHVKIAEEYVCPISYVDCECLSSGLFFIGRILFVFYLQLFWRFFMQIGHVQHILRLQFLYPLKLQQSSTVKNCRENFPKVFWILYQSLDAKQSSKI